jgi:hypothetical protein
VDAIIDHAFEQYVETRALIGTPDTCLAMVQRLQEIGVDELACLIDFGVEYEATLRSLRHLTALKDRCRPATPAPRRRLPLTDGQRAIWSLSQGDAEASTAYHESMLLRLQGPLDLAALRAAVQHLVDRHEALRLTAFDGQWQTVRARDDATVRLTDFSESPSHEQDDKIQAWLEQESRHAFDMLSGPLFRVQVLRRSTQDHLLHFVAHQSIVDRWSVGILLEELATVYAALRRGTTVDLSPAMPFSAYAQWLEAQTKKRHADEAYWLATWTALVPEQTLSTDLPRSTAHAHTGARQVTSIEGEVLHDLRTAGKSSGVTPYIRMLAAFQVWLAQLTAQPRVVVWIPVAGQGVMGVPRLVGPCTNLLPVHAEIDGELSCNDFLQAVRRRLFDVHAHPHASLTALAHQHATAAIPPRAAVFQMDRAPTLPDFADLYVTLVPTPVSSVACDVRLSVLDVDERLLLDFEYRTDLFTSPTIDHWIEQYRALLRIMLEQPQARLAALLKGGAGEMLSSPSQDERAAAKESPRRGMA